MLSSYLFTMMTTFAHAAGLTCSSGEIRATTAGVTKTQSSYYCYNENRNQLSSRYCQERKCKVFKTGRYFTFKDLFDDHSNPGFNLCRRLEGHPEIIEFKVGSEWFKLDRCVFKDGSFVDTGSLLAFYLQR